MHQYEVGKLYHPQRRRWQEGGFYQYRGGQHELLLFFATQSAKEIEAIRQGPADVAFPTDEDLL